MNARRVSTLCTLLLALPLLTGATTSSLSAQPEPGGYPNQVGPGLYRLDGHDPSLPLDDLAPLSRIFKNAELVGVGETLHTSGGQYELRNRVFRYLVEHEGFRVLAIESPYLWVERLEAYLGRCDQPAADFLAGNPVIFNVFRTTETAELVQWMCDWNQSHERPQDKLHVYGFDVQQQARAAGEALIVFLTTLGFAADAAEIGGIRACDGVVESFFPFRPFPRVNYDQCLAALTAVEVYFDEHEGAIERATSPEELAWARVWQVVESSWQQLLWYFFAEGDLGSGFEARDRGMAYLAEAVRDLRYARERVVLWAASTHISQNSQAYIGLQGMGDHLRRSLGEKYRTASMVTSALYTNRPQLGQCGLQDLTVPGVPKVEDLLVSIGEGALIADTNPRGSHPAVFAPGVTYGVGGNPGVPAEIFDALLYLPISPPSQPLPGLPRCP